MVTVARVPIKDGDLQNIPDEGSLLSDAYVLDEIAVIKRAEDFTVSLNTVSRSLFDKYQDHYKAGQFGNDYFVLLSGVGLGNPKAPTLKLHLLENIRKIDNDWTTVWAENIETVEDYSLAGGEERLFLSFHTLCQSLGNTEQQGGVFASLSEILASTGSILPALAPFTALGRVAVDGINNVFNKHIKISGETKEIAFAWYPADSHKSAVPGEAPLQTGAYVFFFEKTDFTALKLKSDGTIENATNPYIVVNVKRGITLAPKQLDTAAGAKVMSHFQSDFGYPLSADKSTTIHSLDALNEFGRSYRLGQQMMRYFKLKKKEGRTSEEENKFTQLLQTLNSAIPDFDSE